jgi:hypothetical protein
MPQCFFYVEGGEEDPNGFIRALCIEHGRKKKGAWFYDGQIGPWVVKCHDCSSVIHQPDEDKNEGQETSPTL